MASRIRIVPVAVALAVPTLALGNGAMPYAYQIFDLGYWAVYVVLTIILEAWIIGVRAGMSWPKAMAGSVLCNAISAGCCQAALGPMHSMSMDPNPFSFTLQVLGASAFLSAIFEALIWSGIGVKFDGWGSSLLLRVLGAHAIGIPLALLVFLLPPHPYRGIDATVSGARARCVQRSLRSAEFRSSLSEHNRLPNIRSVEELEQQFPCRIGSDEDTRWTVAFEAAYGRFDTREMRRKKTSMEWNVAAAGLPMLDEKTPENDRNVWLMRRRDGAGRLWGTVLDRVTGEVRSSEDPALLEASEGP